MYVLSLSLEEKHNKINVKYIYIFYDRSNKVFLTQATPQILTPTTGRHQITSFRAAPQNQQVLFSPTDQVALPSAFNTVRVPAPQHHLSAFQVNGIHNQNYAPLLQAQTYPGMYRTLPANTLGDDPIKAAFISAHSNPFLHLLSAPYLKHIKETDGEDLPTIEEVKELLELSSFGLSGFEEEALE